MPRTSAISKSKPVYRVLEPLDTEVEDEPVVTDSPEETKDPYAHKQEWTTAQRNMVKTLSRGQAVGYVRFFHYYGAGEVAYVDLDKGIMRTSEGFEFQYDNRLGRYVLRGDKHAFLVASFSLGAKTFAKWHGTPVAAKRRLPVFRQRGTQTD